jgi:hypothetical protein
MSTYKGIPEGPTCPQPGADGKWMQRDVKGNLAFDPDWLCPKCAKTETVPYDQESGRKGDYYEAITSGRMGFKLGFTGLNNYLHCLTTGCNGNRKILKRN